MTESEWHSSDDPGKMLTRLLDLPGIHVLAQRIGKRKLRLFACAVNRLCLGPNPGRAIIENLETAECYADGEASADELSQAYIASELWCCFRGRDLLHPVRDGRTWMRPVESASLLRDIAGNPWRPVELPLQGKKCGSPPHPIHSSPDQRVCNRWDCHCPVVCPWLIPAALSLAHAAYDLRSSGGTLDPVRLCVLADALEEAGCDSEAILTPLRGKVPCAACAMQTKMTDAIARYGHPLKCHSDCSGWMPASTPRYRGFHVLDHILNKE